jgi:hypothetical protein
MYFDIKKYYFDRFKTIDVSEEEEEKHKAKKPWNSLPLI